MSDKPTPHATGGIGWTGLLAIVFITLKLCGVITWTWLWVLAPLWIPLAIILALFLVAGVCMVIGLILKE